MCNRYVSPDEAAIERHWRLLPRTPWWRGASVFPRSQGAFVRAKKDEGNTRELVVGQWGLIPHFAKTPKLAYSTNNARIEELASKASYRDSWRFGRRCIIPAVSFDEPCYETGKNVWWTFRRADGALWGLAGLWNSWVDPATGEVHESYTMLTLNADAHPLMRRMHKPDPTLDPDEQDKRSVVPIADEHVDLWLRGAVEEAARLVQLPPVEMFDAGPATVSA